MDYFPLLQECFQRVIPPEYLLSLEDSDAFRSGCSFNVDVSFFPLRDPRDSREINKLPTIGFLGHPFQSRIHCVNLFVPRPFRKRNLGRNLVEGMELFTNLVGYERITIISTNDPFWAHMGYDITKPNPEKVLG